MRTFCIILLALLAVTQAGCLSVFTESTGLILLGKDYREKDFGTATGLGAYYELNTLKTLDAGISLTYSESGTLEEARVAVYGLFRVPLGPALSLRLGGGPVYSATDAKDFTLDDAVGIEARASLYFDLPGAAKLEMGLMGATASAEATGTTTETMSLDQWVVFVGAAWSF